jgi:hypothetical protein
MIWPEKRKNVTASAEVAELPRNMMSKPLVRS